MTSVTASSNSPWLSIDRNGSSNDINEPSTRVMVELASDELIALGWDGRDQKDFDYKPTENGMLIKWKSCTFQQENYEAIQRLVVKKLSSAPANRLALSEEKPLEGRVQVKPSNNDDDGDAFDHRELQTVKAVIQQASHHSLTTNSTQATSSSSLQELQRALTAPKPAELVASPSMKILSGEPKIEEVLLAYKNSRSLKDCEIDTAHLLEHFNLNLLFNLYEQESNLQDQNELLIVIGQKIEIREAFEQSLIEFSEIPCTLQRPKCFISFALEKGVSQWLQKIFVPDLTLAGIDPVFCFKDLRTGMDLNAFQDQILFTDHVVVICTPHSEQYCRDRHPPYGFAQEVVLAKTREKKETVSPVWLKGDPKKFDPNILFGIDNTFGTILNEDGRLVWSYYAKAFRLMGGIKGFLGDRATKNDIIKDNFLGKVKTILKKQDFSINELKQKAKYQDSATRSRIDGIKSRMISIMKKVSLPPCPSPYIEKREESQQLEKLYDNGTRLVAIVGNRGVGKSALALAFANQSKHRFEFIYLIQLSEQTTLRQGLLNFANDLNLDGTEEQQLVSLKNLFERSDQRHLIIFDNVDNTRIFKELAEVVNSSPECCFLLTSVMTQHAGKIGFIPVQRKPYQPEEGLAFLREATRITDDDDNARKIVEALHRLPRALTHAADYIRTIRCRFTTFLENYRTEGMKLFSISLPQNPRTTFLNSQSTLEEIQRLLNGSTGATQLLYFIFCQVDMPVGYKSLKWWASENCFSQVFDQALGWLLEYALLESPAPDFYALSPLLRQEIIDNQQYAYVVDETETHAPEESIRATNSTQQWVTPRIMADMLAQGAKPSQFVGIVKIQMRNPRSLSNAQKINNFLLLALLIPKLNENEFPSLTKPESSFREFFRNSDELREEQAKLTLCLGKWYPRGNPQKSMFFYSTGLKNCEKDKFHDLSNVLHVAASRLLCTCAYPQWENNEQTFIDRIQRIPKENPGAHFASLNRLVQMHAASDERKRLQLMIVNQMGMCDSQDLIHIRNAYDEFSKKPTNTAVVPYAFPTQSYQNALKAFHTNFPDSIPAQVDAIKKLQEGQQTGFISLLNLLLDDAFALIGLPPCDYDIRAVGKITNGAGSRYFPIDFCILVSRDTKKDLSYFYKLLDILHLQMISLGESMDCVGFGDLFDLNAPGDVTRLGLRINQPSRMLMQVGTPQAFVESKLDSELQSLVAYQSMCIKSSSPSLFHDYRIAEGVLREESECISLPRDVGYLVKDAESTINFRKIEEFTHQFLVNVAIHLNISKQNLYTIVDDWTKRAGLKPSTARLITSFLTTIYRIRLRLEHERKNDFDVFEKNDLLPEEEKQLKAGYLLVIKPLLLMLETTVEAVGMDNKVRYSILKDAFDKLIRDLDLIVHAIQSLSPEEVELTIEQLATCLHESQASELTMREYYQLLGAVNSQEDKIRDTFIQTLETLNNPHAYKLLSLPNADRLRLTGTRSRKKFQETLRAITLPEPPSAHPIVKIDSPSLGTCYLKFDDRKGTSNDDDNDTEPLFDKNGELTRKHPGQHPVNSISLANGEGAFLKGMSTDPLNEWGNHDLGSMLGGEMTPQTELVRCEVPGRKLPYPILISQAVNGEPLCNVPNLKWEDCDQKQWTWMFLTQILTKPGDGHEANYLLIRNREKKWMITCIDNDVSLFPSVTRAKNGHLNILFASVLFCLFPTVKLDREVLEEFCTLKGDEILSKWIERLVDKEGQYRRLFTEAELKALYDEESKSNQDSKVKLNTKLKENLKHKFRPTMLLCKGTMLILSRQFSRLQTFIQEKLMASKTSTLTPMDLLKQLVDIDTHDLSQTVGSHVASKYGRCGKRNISLDEQLKGITGKEHSESIAAQDAIEISLGRIPTAQEIEDRKDFTIEQARDELKFFINSKKIFELDFGPVERSRHERMLNAKVQDHLESKAKPEKIVIKNCDALEAKALKLLLHSGVHTLDLSGCRKLENSDIGLIFKICPNLKILRLNQTNITEFDDKSFLTTKLSYLELKECKNLRSINIHSLYLDKVKIFENKERVDKSIKMFIYTSRRIRPPDAFNNVLYTFLTESPLEREYIPKLTEVWYDRDCALDAIKNKVFGLNFIVRPPLKNDREVCLAFLKANQQSTEFKDADPILERLDPKFKSDVEFVKAAIRFQSKNYRCLDEDMQNNEEVALTLIEADPGSSRVLTGKMQMSSQVVVAILRGDSKYLRDINLKLLEDPAIFCFALQQLHNPHREISDEDLSQYFNRVHPSITGHRKVLMEWVAILIKNADKPTIIALLKHWKAVDMAAVFIENLYSLRTREFVLDKHISVHEISITNQFKSRLPTLRNDQNAKELNKKMIILILSWMLENGYNDRSLFKLLLEKIDISYWQDMDVSAALVNFYYFNNFYDHSGYSLDQVDHFKSEKQFMLNVFRPGLRHSISPSHKLRALAAWMDVKLWDDRDVVAEFVNHDADFVNKASAQVKDDEEIIKTCSSKAEEKLKRRSDAVLSDIDRDKYIITYTDEELRTDPKFLCRAMELDRGVLKLITYDYEFAFAMVKIDYRIWDYINEEYQRNPDMLTLMNYRAPNNYVSEFEFRQRDDIEVENTRNARVDPYSFLGGRKKYKWGILRGKGLERYFPNSLFYDMVITNI